MWKILALRMICDPFQGRRHTLIKLILSQLFEASESKR